MSTLMAWDQRVELQGPWPTNAPEGYFHCHEDNGTLIIDHADPRLVISAELIEAVASGHAHPDATITMLDYTIPGGHVGALLKIRAANRQVVYRLTEWLPSIRAYIGEWPEWPAAMSGMGFLG